MKGYSGKGMLAGSCLRRSPVEGGPLLIPNSSPSPAQGSATTLFLQGGFLLVRSLSWTSRSYKTGLCDD